MSTTTFSPALVAAPARPFGLVRRMAQAVRAIAAIDAYAALEASIGLATLAGATAFLAAAF